MNSNGTATDETPKNGFVMTHLNESQDQNVTTSIVVTKCVCLALEKIIPSMIIGNSFLVINSNFIALPI